MTDQDEAIRVLIEALDRAAYALFVAKRLTPDAVREHCAKAHEEACAVLDNLDEAVRAVRKG